VTSFPFFFFLFRFNFLSTLDSSSLGERRYPFSLLAQPLVYFLILKRSSPSTRFSTLWSGRAFRILSVGQSIVCPLFFLFSPIYSLFEKGFSFLFFWAGPRRIFFFWTGYPNGILEFLFFFFSLTIIHDLFPLLRTRFSTAPQGRSFLFPLLLTSFFQIALPLAAARYPPGSWEMLLHSFLLCQPLRNLFSPPIHTVDATF